MVANDFDLKVLLKYQNGYATRCEARLCRAVGRIRGLGCARRSGSALGNVGQSPDEGHSPKRRSALTARQSRASHPVAKPYLS